MAVLTVPAVVAVVAIVAVVVVVAVATVLKIRGEMETKGMCVETKFIAAS